MRSSLAGIVASLLVFSVAKAETGDELPLRLIRVDYTVEYASTSIEVTSVHRRGSQLIVIAETSLAKVDNEKPDRTKRSALVAVRAAAELSIVRHLKADRWYEQLSAGGRWRESEGPPDLDEKMLLYGGAKNRTAVARTKDDALAGQVHFVSPTQVWVEGKQVQGPFKRRDDGALFVFMGKWLGDAELFVVDKKRRLGRAGWRRKVSKTCNRYIKKAYRDLGSAFVSVASDNEGTSIQCIHRQRPNSPDDGMGVVTLTFDAESKQLVSEDGRGLPLRTGKRVRKPRLRF